MGGGQSSASMNRRDKLQQLNLDKNRVPFQKNRNKDDDSDYDDEEDSKIESIDDLASESDHDQEAVAVKSKALKDGS